jgi:hypothetical protein
VSASFLASNLVFFIEADYYFILAETLISFWWISNPSLELETRYVLTVTFICTKKKGNKNQI